jgi:Na+-transporting NADH:ubiquinone oxidoreductase subunit B
LKFLRNFLDNQAKHFEQGGKLSRFQHLFEAADTFLYTTSDVTKGAPHIRDVLDFKRLMITVVYALIPTVIMALYNTGLQANLALQQMGITLVEDWRGGILSFLHVGLNPDSITENMVHGALYFLPVYLITLIAGGAWEVLFSIIRKHPISEGFLVTSLLFPLILPPDIPWWQVVLGISFGVIIGKEVFGGVGMNVLNPALTGRVFLYFAYPGQISGDAVWVAVDGYSRATPLAELADPVLNLTVTFKEAFLGIIPGSMGETSALACLIGALFLIVTKVGAWRIMLSTVIGMVALSLIFNWIGSNTNPMFQVSPWWHFVLGGFAFGTVYMATDPVSAAHSQQGQWLYGMLIGALTVLIRVINPGFPEGIMLAILFGNVFAPAIDKIFVSRNIRRRQLNYAK